MPKGRAVPSQVTEVTKAITEIARTRRDRKDPLRLALNQFQSALTLWINHADSAPARVESDGSALISELEANLLHELALKLEEAMSALR